MERRRDYPIYRAIRWLVWFFYPRIRVEGAENLPEGPCIAVGNHTQMNGPIMAELYFPGKHYTWCAAEMMHAEEVPGYAFTDFWSQKPRWTHGFFKLLSYIITPVAVVVFNNADTIPVRRDARALSTFRETVEKLQQGARVVIFPEQDKPHNHIVYDFQEGFVDVARFYQRRAKADISFVPVYFAPKLKKMVIGKPVAFDPNRPIDEERRRICDAMMDGITAIAESLPPHTVVPYRNIPKKNYPMNIPQGGKKA